MREDRSDLGRGFLTTLRYLGMLTVPMAVGLALVADPLVRTLFGEKWLEAIPVTTAIAVYTLIRSLYFSAGDVFKAQGRPEIVTRLHLLNLVVLVPALWWAAVRFESVVAVAWMQVAVVTVVGAVRMVVAARLLNLRLGQFGRILAPVLAGSALMAACGASRAAADGCRSAAAAPGAECCRRAGVVHCRHVGAAAGGHAARRANPENRAVASLTIMRILQIIDNLQLFGGRSGCRCCLRSRCSV